MKYLILIALIFTVLSSQAAEVRVKSNPSGSIVFTENAKTGKRVKIGKTPLVVSWDELESKNGKDTPFIIDVSKEGFNPYRLLVVGLKKEDLELSANLDVQANIKHVEDFDFLMGDLFDIQRLIRTRDYKDALDKLARLERKFPHYSVIPELRGSIHYLNKDLKRSLASYRKAFSLNSKNRDAYRMKKYLETHFGIRN